MAFSIPCPSCARAFSLDAELFERRVEGKIVRFKCPECAATSSVDGIRSGALRTLDETEAAARAVSADDLVADDAEVSELSDDEVASLPPDEVAALQRRPPPRPRLESKIDDELWVVSVREGAEDQEVFESSLVHLIASGKMPPDAIVWREGMADWLALADVPELAQHLPPADDKTGGFLGTGMHPSFGSNPERKSTPPPLPPKKRSYGSAKKKSHGHKGGEGTKPVALSPGFLFSVDDAESEPPQDLETESPKGPKAAPKPPLRAPKRAVTRDLDFSDIAEDEESAPLSGTPALKDLTTHLSKSLARDAKPPQSSRQLFAGLGGGDEQVLGPPSIDISDIAGPRKAPAAKAREPQAAPSSTPAASKGASESPPSSKRASKRPKARPSKRPAQARSSRRPAAEAESARPSRRPKAVSGGAQAAQPQEAGGWFTPGRVLVLLAIAGLAYFLFSRQMQRRAPSEAVLEPPTQAQTPEPAREPAPSEPQPEQAAPGESEAAAVEAAEPEASQPAPKPAATPPRGDERAVAPAAAPVAPEARAKPAAERDGASAAPASDEPKAPVSAAPPKPAVDAPPFNKDAAVSALNTAVGQASGCRQEGDPSGTARVVVTFAPSGRVTSANLNGPPFAGTRTGGCIAATMRRATVPPFSGSHVTVAKSVVIR